MDSQSSPSASEPAWFNEVHSPRTSSFFDNVFNTPPTISDAGMQSMPFSHPSPFAALPIRSVENSPAPAALSPFSWSAFLVTGMPSMSPGGPDILSSRVQIQSAEISTITSAREPDIPFALGLPEEQTSALPQARNTQPDWETHRPKIKALYMDENLSLKDTRQIMRDTDGLCASSVVIAQILGVTRKLTNWIRRKQYTAKIKEWGWVKNIPSSKADWMLKKADERKERYRKDTTFRFGDREWTVDRIQRSARRAKSHRIEEIGEDLPTPSDITYSTPHTSEQPGQVVVSPGRSVLPPAIWESSSSQVPQVHTLQLVWNGHTRSDIEKIFREAQVLECTGKLDDAEPKLRQALAGLENLLTPTHEDTNKVAYHLADFYARNNRMKDADMVLSRIIDAHMGQWGIEHKKTIAHLAHVADLFHHWSRVEDAVTLLSRAAEAHQRLLQNTASAPSGSGGARVEFMYPRCLSHGNTLPSHSPTDNSMLDSSQSDQTQIEYQINLTRARICASGTVDENVEEVLLGLIKSCERYPDRMAVQILEVNHTLVEFYQTLKSPDKVSKSLADAENAFWAIMKSDGKKTILLLRTAIDLINLHVKNERFVSADLMFEEIQSKVVEEFGIDDDATISILISIGVIYQNQMRWSDAQPRFEQALAAAMTSDGLESSITQQLEEALENRCYVRMAPECRGKTSQSKHGSHCFGRQFGCSDTSSLLNTLISSNIDR